MKDPGAGSLLSPRMGKARVNCCTQWGFRHWPKRWRGSEGRADIDTHVEKLGLGELSFLLETSEYRECAYYIHLNRKAEILHTDRQEVRVIMCS